MAQQQNIKINIKIKKNEKYETDTRLLHSAFSIQHSMKQKQQQQEQNQYIHINVCTYVVLTLV